MPPRTCVITGATSGIGRAAALALGSSFGQMVLVGRNERAGQALADRVRRTSPGARAEFVRTDLAVQSEVRRLAQRIAERCQRVDVLINNAGARFNTYQETQDGIERTLAINHLSHFLLTALVMHQLLQAPQARVVTVGSGAHAGLSSQGEWCLSAANYERKLAYGQSKLANIMFAYELGRRLRGTTVTSNAVDPGGVATNLGRNNGLLAWLKHLAYYALKGQLLSPQRGAETIVYLATAKELEGVNGKYFYQKAQSRSSAASYDEQAARQLWALSVRLTKLDAGLGKAWEYYRPGETHGSVSSA